MFNVWKSGSLGLEWILCKFATVIDSVDIFVLQTWLTALLDLTDDECHNIYTEIVQGCLEEESFIKGNISVLISILNLINCKFSFKLLLLVISTLSIFIQEKFLHL